MIPPTHRLHAPIVTLPGAGRLARHLERLDEDGYTVIPDVLDRGTCARLRELIDSLTPPPEPPRAAGPMWHELRHPIRHPFMAELITPAHLDLATTLLRARELRLLEQLLRRSDPTADPAGARDWHIDMVLLPRHRDATPRQIYLQLIHALSDVETGGGALMVVPGSHRLTYAAAAAGSFAPAQGRELLTAAGVDLSSGIEVLAREGDLMIFHPMCAHSASVNRSERSRYVFFQSFYDASATDLAAELERTGYRSRFPDELRDGLPRRLRRLLTRQPRA